MNIKDSPQFEILFIFFAYQVALAAFAGVVYDILFLGLGLSIIECFKILQEKVKNLNLKRVKDSNVGSIVPKITPNAARNSLENGVLIEKHNELLYHAKIFCECFQLPALIRFLTIGGSICILGLIILEVVFSK